MKTRSFDPETLDYYETEAEAFAGRSVGADLSEVYGRFLPHLPAAGRILDAGCGSGRDAKAFLDLGYEVLAIDAAEALVHKAREHIGSDARVHHLRFDQIPWRDSFDGIWACASLLHVPLAALPEVLHILRGALKPEGILYASFKRGETLGEERRASRLFLDGSSDALRAWFDEQEGLHLREIWESYEARPDVIWVNALLERA